jgi:hypothetical protein
MQVSTAILFFSKEFEIISSKHFIILYNYFMILSIIEYVNLKREKPKQTPLRSIHSYNQYNNIALLQKYW